MICVRDSAALIAIVDEQGRIVGTLRQDDILVPARWADEDDSASPR
jgi:CBS-domain-containing membrane protein